MNCYCHVYQGKEELYLLFSEQGLVGVDWKCPSCLITDTVSMSIIQWIDQCSNQLDQYFRRELIDFSLPTSFIGGTPFQRGVWQALREIPYGETISYKDLAKRVGSPLAQQAVGQAVSCNPLPIIYPCHRVIRSDGSLGGYAGGSELKKALLNLEGHHY